MSVPASNSKALVTRWVICSTLGLLATGCRSREASVAPAIEFMRVPPAGEGSPDTIYPIQGRVKGAHPGQRIVLFARAGTWWVQPLADQPYTPINADSTWKSSTHPGSAYAALLVDTGYAPPTQVNELPHKGGLIRAVAVADGAMLGQAPFKTVDFSGYEWVIRQSPGNPAGTRNLYDASNAWVDRGGFLHLRIAKGPSGWTSAEVSLARSLGYGLYRFVVSDISRLEPSMALAITSIDSTAPNQEMDIEISRWGETGGKNGQFVVQPYYVPANVVRFLSPEGRLTYAFDWEPGRVTFRTIRGLDHGTRPDVVASHTFTSGVPSPGNETLHLHLYIFGNTRAPVRAGTEVVIEKFEYLP